MKFRKCVWNKCRRKGGCRGNSLKQKFNLESIHPTGNNFQVYVQKCTRGQAETEHVFRDQ